MIGAWLFGFCCAWVAISVIMSPPSGDLTATTDFLDYMAGALWAPFRMLAEAKV